MNKKLFLLTLLASAFVFAGCTDMITPEKIQPVSTSVGTSKLTPPPTLPPVEQASSSATATPSATATATSSAKHTK